MGVVVAVNRDDRAADLVGELEESPASAKLAGVFPHAPLDVILAIHSGEGVIVFVPAHHVTEP